MAKEPLNLDSFTKQALRKMSASGSAFGISVFGTATFGGTTNAYTKQPLPANTFAVGALAVNAFTKGSIPANTFTKQALTNLIS